MIKRFTVLLTMIFITACGGGGGSEDFQQNETTGFELTEMTEGYGAVDSAWNSVDAHQFNDRLEYAVDRSGPEDFEISSYGLADVIDFYELPLTELVRSDLKSIVERIVDTDNAHIRKQGVDSVFTASAQTYNRGFYSFLDRVSGEGLEVPPDYITGTADKVVRYILNDSLPNDGYGEKAWLNEQVQELAEDLSENDVLKKDFNDDFIDISKLITKSCIQTDYPVWLDGDDHPLGFGDIIPSQHTNLDMGNAVQGSHDLVAWLNPLIMNPDTRALLREAMLDFNRILNPSPEAELGDKIKALVMNLEEYFTKGGAVYEADPIYHQNDELAFSDSELGQLIRDSSPLMQQLFTRSDRPQAIIVTDLPGDNIDNDKDGTIDESEDPVYPLDLMTANLRSIGFDPDTIDVERSIYDLMRHDIWGRDRTDPESGAWPASHLESLLFLTQASANFGWRDGGDTTGELNPSGLADASSRSKHGHGDFVEMLTLNDALFSINQRTIAQNGVYELALRPDAEQGNHIYRSKTAFNLSQVDQLFTGQLTGDDIDYRFFYDQNYGVLNFLAGPGAGDLGSPSGGNPEGRSLGLNQYLAYSPNGLNETQLAAWPMGSGVRACFKGEGPYYYADPNAENVTINGTVYRKYLRPDGKIYAFVNGDGTHYIYPTDVGDAPDEDLPPEDGIQQRANRYKSVWYSDYYITHFEDYNTIGLHHFITVDNCSNVDKGTPGWRVEDCDFNLVAKEITEDSAAEAGRLVFKEAIEEDAPERACASPDEAFYRNYQWVMTEKKMVILLPLHMNLDDNQAAVFVLQEANGYAGLGNLRKFRGNHVWAKKSASGPSDIPGDYRVEAVSKYTEGDSVAEGNYNPERSVYGNTQDCGNATPAVVGHNMPALYRLAFPLSTEMDRGNAISDKILGSREFNVGDENWSHRNALVPILFALLSGLRDHTPGYTPDSEPNPIRSGMRTFLSQTAIWVKPLYYFNKNETIYPKNSWIPRVRGEVSATNRYHGLAFLKSSSDFYSVGEAPAESPSVETNTRSGLPETYYGSEREQLFYQPLPIKTFLNVLIDSDLTDVQKRMDGLLPLVTDTRALSNLLKVLLHEGVNAPPLEQILTATKFTQGEMARINASPESGKGLVYPEWMFVTGAKDDSDIANALKTYTEYAGVRGIGTCRQDGDQCYYKEYDDIILDEILDRIVGHDTPDPGNPDSPEGYGLANYPDKQARLDEDDDPSEDGWDDLYDIVDTLGDLLYDFGLDSDDPQNYCIANNLLDTTERLFARERAYTSDEIYGMLYVIGKLFGRYDGERWHYQGEDAGPQGVYNMLATRVPSMNSAVVQKESLTPSAVGGPNARYAYGDHYYSQLVFMSKTNEPLSDGRSSLMEYVFNAMTAPQNWETIMRDVNRFMNGHDISSDDSELWPTLAELLRDMGSAVAESNQSGVLADVMNDFGFQVN